MSRSLAALAPSLASLARWLRSLCFLCLFPVLASLSSFARCGRSPCSLFVSLLGCLWCLLLCLFCLSGLFPLPLGVARLVVPPLYVRGCPRLASLVSVRRVVAVRSALASLGWLSAAPLRRSPSLRPPNPLPLAAASPGSLSPLRVASVASPPRACAGGRPRGWGSPRCPPCLVASLLVFGGLSARFALLLVRPRLWSFVRSFLPRSSRRRVLARSLRSLAAGWGVPPLGRGGCCRLPLSLLLSLPLSLPLSLSLSLLLSLPLSPFFSACGGWWWLGSFVLNRTGLLLAALIVRAVFGVFVCFSRRVVGGGGSAFLF